MHKTSSSDVSTSGFGRLPASDVLLLRSCERLRRLLLSCAPADEHTRLGPISPAAGHPAVVPRADEAFVVRRFSAQKGDCVGCDCGVDPPLVRQ